MAELPKGWVGSSIGNTGQYINGMAFKPTDWKETGTPIIRIKNLTNPSASINRTSRAVPDSVKVTKGTILVSWSATLDAFIWDREDAVLNQHIFKVVPDESVVTKTFLFYLLRSEIAAMREGEHLHGSTMKHINRGPFLSHEVALPPLAEQKRIADKLEAVLGRVDACRARLDRVPALLKRFRQSVLAAATSGRLTEEWRMTNGVSNEWESIELADAADDFSYGTSVKSSKTGKVAVLRMGNIQDGKLDWEGLVYTSDVAEISKYRLVKGDVLFNRTNSPELVGKTCVFDGKHEAIHAGYLIRVKCSDRLIPEFLNYCLNSPDGKDYCWQVKTDGVSQSNINAKKLAALPMLLPTLPEQKEIVRRVEDLFAFADRIEARLATAQKTVERLTPATLAKAFRGELVPQDPNDEPASTLLTRLHTEPATNPAKAKRIKRP